LKVRFHKECSNTLTDPDKAGSRLEDEFLTNTGDYLLANSKLHLASKDYEKANIKYAEACTKSLATILPFMVRTKDKKLSLTKYTLSQGHCEGIAAALKVFPDYADTFRLEDNNLSDRMTSLLISAM